MATSFRWLTPSREDTTSFKGTSARWMDLGDGVAIGGKQMDEGVVDNSGGM